MAMRCSNSTVKIRTSGRVIVLEKRSSRSHALCAAASGSVRAASNSAAIMVGNVASFARGSIYFSQVVDARFDVEQADAGDVL